jgi:LmbE family N-acetylglucosaminyl deacetylase
VATLVCFHAHPDDEAIATGGTMRMAADDGHRVVLVVATGGERGEVADGVLAPGETLGQRRRVEQEAAARLLGVARLEWLGYEDSGMDGEPTNDEPASFWQADLDEAAGRLAAILTEEEADVLTCYDDHGNYGHPDHVKVHLVGRRAAELAGTPRVYESTMNRDHLSELRARARAEHVEVPDEETFGTPDAEITTAIDVRPVLAAKREAMAAHGSQITEESFFLSMPPEAFEEVFGTEWYIRIDRRPADRESSLFAGLS